MVDGLLPLGLAEAQPLDNLKADVLFRVSPVFFYGSDDLCTGNYDAVIAAKSEPLLQPNIPLYEGWARADDAVKHKDELAQHYLDVLRLMQKYHKTIQESKLYFWCRPYASAPDITFTFPWYDTWPETIHLFDSLRSEKQGEIFYDIDQGWEFVVLRQNDWLYFYESYPDAEPKVLMFIRVSQAIVQESVTAAQTVAGELLRYLVRKTGINPWKYAP